MSQREQTDEREALHAAAKEIMMLTRASRGETPIPQENISYMMNIRSPYERSGYPTFGIVQLIAYFRLGHKIWGDDAQVLEDAATILSECLVPYKRQQRREAIDMAHKTEAGQTTFAFGVPPPPQPKKRGWFRRGAKQPRSEFPEE